MLPTLYDAVIRFPKMNVAVATREGCVSEIRYLPPSVPEKAATNALAARAVEQIENYLNNPDMRFELPLLVEGTEFQRKLWDALCEIPRGKTLTYGQLAQRLGAEARAVGQACGDNRLPIVIPCHRVVAARGIGGFAHSTGGYLIEAKRWLLMHECGADAFELTP
jgi:methylated-DNA-[protein]-cysteine S-methyltransferase